MGSEVVGTEFEKNFATNDLFLIDMTKNYRLVMTTHHEFGPWWWLWP